MATSLNYELHNRKHSDDGKEEIDGMLILMIRTIIYLATLAMLMKHS